MTPEEMNNQRFAPKQDGGTSQGSPVLDSSLGQDANMVQSVNQNNGTVSGQPVNQMYGIMPGQPVNQNSGIMPGQPVNQMYGTMPSQPVNQTYGTIPMQPQNQTFGTMPGQMANTGYGMLNGQPMGPAVNTKKKNFAPLIAGVSAAVLLGGGGVAYGVISHNAKVRQEAEEAAKIAEYEAMMEADRLKREEERLARKEAEEKAQREAEEKAQKEAEEAAEAAKKAEEEAQKYSQEMDATGGDPDYVVVNNCFANWGCLVDTAAGYFYADYTDACLYYQPIEGGDSVAVDDGFITGLVSFSNDSVSYIKEGAVWVVDTEGNKECIIEDEEGIEIWYVLMYRDRVVLLYEDDEAGTYYLTVDTDYEESEDVEIYSASCVTMQGDYIYYVAPDGNLYRCRLESFGMGMEEYLCEVNNPVAFITAGDQNIYWLEPNEDGYHLGMYDTYYEACDTFDSLETELALTCLNEHEGKLYFAATEFLEDQMMCSVWSEDLTSGELVCIYEGDGHICNINMVTRADNFTAVVYNLDESWETIYIDLPEE